MVDPEKVEVLRDWPKQKTFANIKRFMGLTQFFHRFIKGFSKLASPLTNLTKKEERIQKWEINWDDAFGSLKKEVTTAPILVSTN